jgi:signal transduction histidine kinase
VLQNLIGNAIKYGGNQAPRIHLSVQPSGDLWRFSVADNGIGIDPAQTERVFQMFTRLHGRETEGTGIGLAICKRMVNQWGGTIWVEANPAQGSTFHFTIPRGEMQ